MFEVVEEELLATFMATKTINEGTDWDKQVFLNATFIHNFMRIMYIW
jgi:hypothetical protein